MDFDHLWYWSGLDHAEVSYVVAANDAENLSVSPTFSTASAPSMKYTLPAVSDSGTVAQSFSTVEHISFTPSEDWNLRITASYTLGGLSQSQNFDYIVTPQLKGELGFSDDGISASGPVTSKSVSGTLSFTYPADDRHTYAPSVYELRLGWAKEASGGSLFGDFEPVGDTKQIWFYWDGPGPFSDAGAPAESGGRMRMPISYSTTLDATPSAEAAAAGATHFYLIFGLSGEGTDIDSTTYSIREPSECCCYPQPLSVSLVAPTVSFSSLRYWGEFNAPGYGVDLFELSYVLTPNDAADLTADVTLSSVVGSYSWSSLPQIGTVRLRRSAGGEPFNVSSAQWTPQVTLHYSLGGVDKDETFNFGVVPLTAYAPRFNLSYSGSSITATLVKDSGDPFSYSFSGISSIELDWMQQTGEDSWTWLGTETLYPGTGTLETVTAGSVCRYTIPSGSLTPPAGATHFMIGFLSSGYIATDENGTDYTVSVSPGTYDDFHPISELP